MSDAMQHATNSTVELIIPGLAAGGGAGIAAVLGPPRSNRQHVADIGAMVVAGVLVGPWACESLDITTRNGICAASTTLGLLGPIVLRAALAVVDAVAIRVEAGKSDTAKSVVGILNRLLLNRIGAWLRTPESAVAPPPPPSPPTSPPIIVIAQKSPPTAEPVQSIVAATEYTPLPPH